MLGKNTVAAILMGAIASNVAIVQVVAAKSLTAKEIYNLANKFVVKIDGDGGGSGFIVSKTGNRYTVLTNDHVTKTSSQHTITTHDGKTYTSEGVKSFKSANGLDLAEIEFESDDRYQVAQLASKPDYGFGTKVYTVGWNATNQNLTQRRSNILEGTISGAQPQKSSGYTLMMNLIAVPGMSGSPLLDNDGKVIGIYGQANRETQEGTSFATATLGIKISNYRNVTSSLLSVVSTISNDQPPAKKSRSITTENSDGDRSNKIRLDYKGFKLAQTITVDLGGGYEHSLISPDGNILIVGGRQGLQIRRVSDGVVTYSSAADYGFIRSLAISTDGQTLAIGSDQGIVIRKTSNGHIIKQINDDKAGWSIAMSGDGTTVAGTHLNDTIKIWRVSDGEMIRTITAQNPYLSSVQIDGVAISPDGRYIASVGVNDSTRVWQLSNGKLLKTFPRGSAQLNKISFSVDSMILFVSGWSSPYDDHQDIVRSWGVSTGKLITTAEYPSSELPNYNFYSINSNRRILIGISSNALQVWRR